MLSAEVWDGFRSYCFPAWWSLSSPLFLVSSIPSPSSRFHWCHLSRPSGFVAQPQWIQLFPEPLGHLLTFPSLISPVWEIPAAFQLLCSSVVSRLCFCKAWLPVALGASSASGS